MTPNEPTNPALMYARVDAVKRLRELGISSDDLIGESILGMFLAGDGKVLISKDRPGQKPEFGIWTSNVPVKNAFEDFRIL